MNIDTDLEIQRYQEATDMLSHAFNPEELAGLPRQYNPLSRRNLIMQELPSGGYVQVGEEDLPQPQVMSTAPKQPTGLTRQEEAQKLRETFQRRGQTFTQEDLEAAGLGDVVFDDVPDERPQGVATEQIQSEGPGQLEADPTIRENLHFGLKEAFMNIGDYLGYIPGIPTNVEFQNFKIPEPMAEQLAGFVSGKNNLGVGAIEVGPGAIMTIQEGQRLAERGNIGSNYQSMYPSSPIALAVEEGFRAFQLGNENGDPLTRALGALEMGLGAAEAMPAFKPLSQGIKEGLRIVRQRLNQPGPMPTVGSNFGNVFAPSATQVRAEGGLPIDSAKGDENLRLHLQRIEKLAEGKSYPGAPKNPRTVIKAPEGSNLPDVVVGDITVEDWQNRIETAMSPEQINKAATWYKTVFGEFQKQANGDPEEIARLTDAWFAGQQNSSPGQTLNDVLFVYEQIKRGVPKDQLKGKGLPSANKIVIDILTQSEITGGAGQKIADFLDSGYGKNVRSIMSNKPEGGSPFVVDVHTARDTGLVDQIYINHLTRLGYDVPDNLKIDFGGGGINGAPYENRALFGQKLTRELNAKNWMGRSNWEPAEIQAIGWMQLSGMYGAPNVGGDIVDAFTLNTRRISMEVDPGAGSPFAEKFGEDFAALPSEDKIAINNELTAKAIELVNKQTGITLGSNVHGTGGWELFQNPSTVQQAIASKDTAINAAARLGYLLQQTEVWVNSSKPFTKNPQNFSIDIIETSGESLRESERLTELFENIIEAEPNNLFRGYQPIIVDGKPGIRIIVTKEAISTAVKNSPLKKAEMLEYIQDFARNKLGDITDSLNFDAEVDIMEADLTQLRNDWTKDQTGGGYKSYFSGQSGKNASTESSISTILNTDGAELEKLFRSRIEDAKARGQQSSITGSTASNTEAADGN